jgi:hypothetical protein
MGYDMLHHAELIIFFQVLDMFEFIWIWNLVWIWIWKPYRKNRKGIRKSREKEKEKAAQTSPARPSQATRLCARVAWQAHPACQQQFPSPALALYLALCPLGPTCRRQFSSPARSLSLSLSRGPGSPVTEPLPRTPLSSLSVSWACPVSSAPSALAVDRRVRTRARRRISRPRRSPTCPAPFLEPHQCPAHAPRLISHSFTLSRALPTPRAAVGDPRPRSRPSRPPETAPSLPELLPKVRHLSLCSISPIAPCARPISPSPVLGRGGRAI